MDALELSDEQIMTVWDWCFETYIQHNVKLQFPAHTDPTKTYQWRYVRAIALKFAEWGFDEPTSRKFIDIAVAHAKEVGVFRKGLAALHQTNLLKICYSKLQSQSDTNGQSLDSLRHMHNWLANRSNGNMIDTLLYRDDVDELCNIVKWVLASRLSPLYLSLSKVCGQALARLSTSGRVEREFLPKTTKLYMLRSEFLEDANNVNQAIRIFGPDWRRMCL